MMLIYQFGQLNNMIIKYSEEVKQALKLNKPVVALESTIISHGMPYPKNLEVARTCETIIRNNGATPATIAVIEGEICVGLNDEQLELLAKAKDVLKLSRRDLSYAVAFKKNGASTVALTMLIAKEANISLFATGGIGGVHKDVLDTFDISQDLEELSKTNVTVVCAGAKSILDLEKTMEYLETKSVLVIGYKTDELPAFFTRRSDVSVPLRLDTPSDIAKVIQTKNELGIENAILVTNPIDEKYQVDYDLINNAIKDAENEMKKEGIKGKKVTPYLLSKINEITKGVSLEANCHLVYSNCDLAAKIAVELKKQ